MSCLSASDHKLLESLPEGTEVHVDDPHHTGEYAASLVEAQTHPNGAVTRVMIGDITVVSGRGPTVMGDKGRAVLSLTGHNSRLTVDDNIYTYVCVPRVKITFTVSR